eukprot:COSAG02_NODE_3144_length_7290_cov_18.513559_6_plen_433_part_00
MVSSPARARRPTCTARARDIAFYCIRLGSLAGVCNNTPAVGVATYDLSLAPRSDDRGGAPTRTHPGAPERIPPRHQPPQARRRPARACTLLLLQLVCTLSGASSSMARLLVLMLALQLDILCADAQLVPASCDPIITNGCWSCGEQSGPPYSGALGFVKCLMGNNGSNFSIACGLAKRHCLTLDISCVPSRTPSDDETVYCHEEPAPLPPDLELAEGDFRKLSEGGDDGSTWSFGLLGFLPCSLVLRIVCLGLCPSRVGCPCWGGLGGGSSSGWRQTKETKRRNQMIMERLRQEETQRRNQKERLRQEETQRRNRKVRTRQEPGSQAPLLQSPHQRGRENDASDAIPTVNSQPDTVRAVVVDAMPVPTATTNYLQPSTTAADQVYSGDNVTLGNAQQGAIHVDTAGVLAAPQHRASSVDESVDVTNSIDGTE